MAAHWLPNSCSPATVDSMQSMQFSPLIVSGKRTQCFEDSVPGKRSRAHESLVSPTGHDPHAGAMMANPAPNYADTQLLLSIPHQLLNLEMSQARQLQQLDYSPPVSFIYNPLEYAVETHSQFVYRYCTTTKPVLFVGMNPGPFGMAQTGVPFGEVNMVRDWLGIYGYVGKPPREHPNRPITGFGCHRSEVSGQRFWGFFQDLCKTPDNFFRYAFVQNYCPLVFVKDSGKNVTPNDLPLANRKQVQDICDRSIVDMIRLLQVKVVIGLGRFSEERVKAALQSAGIYNIPVGFLMHPSPINPVANRGWNAIAMQQLSQMDVLRYFMPQYGMTMY
uniref:Uracil-DNA glycosylase-like domain-containing protein n=1 Tax=Strigamia maritima TaxID=126957 RepID=T1IWC8_STRMM